MKQVLCDASVVVKWFLDEPGPETGAARALADRAADEQIELHVLDLTYHEVGNTLVAKRGVPGAVAAALLDKIEAVCGTGLPLAGSARAAACELVAERGLTFYDAAYVAMAQQLEMPLVSADRTMLAAGGVSASRMLETLA